MSETTQYLYEYKNQKPARSLGFLKLEQKPDKMTIQIYSRDMDQVKGIVFETEAGLRYIAGWEPQEYEFLTESEAEPLEKKQEEMPLAAEEYIIPQNVIFEKIQRQDLVRLPKKDWRLANNSFLLHGFYNYHHLLYIEDDGAVWIGVPGIYHEKEKRAAKVFGFTNFRRVSDVDVELEEEEMNNYEDFGYWCRQILNPNL